VRAGSIFLVYLVAVFHRLGVRVVLMLRHQRLAAVRAFILFFGQIGLMLFNLSATGRAGYAELSGRFCHQYLRENVSNLLRGDDFEKGTYL
jgi:hypothetical protein